MAFPIYFWSFIIGALSPGVALLGLWLFKAPLTQIYNSTPVLFCRRDVNRNTTSLSNPSRSAPSSAGGGDKAEDDDPLSSKPTNYSILTCLEQIIVLQKDQAESMEALMAMMDTRSPPGVLEEWHGEVRFRRHMPSAVPE
ncbi:hypothetical protein F4819DRAFT_84446 [Hypoxylon fuscum]|nr:hypothetical protein F4819DRAFT_84446 [Hypoxylon fuscum]